MCFHGGFYCLSSFSFENGTSLNLSLLFDRRCHLWGWIWPLWWHCAHFLHQIGSIPCSKSLPTNLCVVTLGFCENGEWANCWDLDGRGASLYFQCLLGRAPWFYACGVNLDCLWRLNARSENWFGLVANHE